MLFVLHDKHENYSLWTWCKFSVGQYLFEGLLLWLNFREKEMIVGRTTYPNVNVKRNYISGFASGIMEWVWRSENSTVTARNLYPRSICNEKYGVRLYRQHSVHCLSSKLTITMIITLPSPWLPLTYPYHYVTTTPSPSCHHNHRITTNIPSLSYHSHIITPQTSTTT